ncbi:MAG: GmrSD restriction endonuclease domain-containing protein [Candidatus Njordarchaeales archaeon]
MASSEPLQKLNIMLEYIKAGRIVLPDFQRSFVWDPESVRELLVSVLGNYYIGAILILGPISKKNAPFSIRLLEGVKKVNPSAQIDDVVYIILDGQQRLTSLFYARYEPQIPLRGKKYRHVFFVDVEKALNKDWDSAIIGVSEKNIKKIEELSSEETIIRFSDLFDIKKLAKKFKDHPKIDAILDLANRVINYQLNIIFLRESEGLERIVETFERINRTGLPLSLFDLLVARLYKHQINLRELLEETRKRYDFIKYIRPEYIVYVIALIRNKDLRRKSILNLQPANFERDWEKACEALELAYKRIINTKGGYGAFDFKNWVPYASMIVPLAAMIWYLKQKRIDHANNYKKIDIWYWVSVFNNRYEHSTQTIAKTDFDIMKKWFENDSEIPNFIKEFDPKSIDLDVKSRSSAIFRGVINLIVLKGAYDFKTGGVPTLSPSKAQCDHIFPWSIYRENSVLNRTIIVSNQSKIDKKPSEYFRERINELGRGKVEEILSTHLIPKSALDDLLEDKLKDFMKKRRKAILKEIKRRTKI